MSLTNEDIAKLCGVDVREVEDANAENKLRLRNEVTVLGDRIRRYLLDAYKEEWGNSITNGELLKIRGDPDIIDAIVVSAVQKAYGGKELRLGPGDAITV